MRTAEDDRDDLTRRHALLRANEVFVGATVGRPMRYSDLDDATLARIRALDEPGLASALSIYRHPSESWSVADDIALLFSIHRYDAAEHPSYVVMDPDDEPLGTFLCEWGLLHEEIVVRDETSAPVGEVRTRHHRHELREMHGPPLATCKRILDRPGDSPLEEGWHLTIESDDDVLDRRVLLALPLVCALTSHPKRHVDPDCTLAGILLVALPPVGAGLLLLEETIDGWYWLRRKLE